MARARQRPRGFAPLGTIAGSIGGEDEGVAGIEQAVDRRRHQRGSPERVRPLLEAEV
jgi:hypothetical protein